MGLIAYTKRGDSRVQRTVHGFESATRVNGTGWYRRRFPRGGDGSLIVWGQLINEVPKNSLLEDECVELELFEGGAFSFVMDDQEVPEKVVVWAHNPNLYSAIRGSVDVPVRVWGEIFTVERIEGEGEEEVTVTKQVLLIMSHPDKMAATHGHLAEPDNNKGQALITPYGSHADTADGGPCGGE